MNFKNFTTRISGLSGLFLFVAAVCNLYLAYRASSTVRRHVVCVTNFVEVATSVPHSETNTPPPSFPSFISPSPSSIPSRPDVSVPHEVAVYPYQYFLVGRRIGVQMFGRYYYEGSPCSYGRIDKIFPDRILLASGDWITNRIQNDVVLKEMKRHD